MPPAVRHGDDRVATPTFTWGFLHPLGLTASCVVRAVAPDGPWQIVTTIGGQVIRDACPNRPRAIRRAMEVAATLNAGRWYTSEAPPP